MSENKPMFHVEPDARASVPRGTIHKTLKHCPLCIATNFTDRIKAIDHTTTGEQFTIQECTSCGFYFTNPQPLPEELGRYYASDAYISHSETKKGLVNWLYHIAQQWNIHNKFNKCMDAAPPGKWADYGSGAGAFVKFAENKGVQITGFEPSLEAREVAALKGLHTHPIEAFPLDQKYACITLWHVLEHIPDLTFVLENIVRAITPGGVLVIAVPNRASHDAQKYKQHWAALDVPRHLWHFTEKDLHRIADTLQLTLDSIHPMKLDSYYVSMLSEKYRRSSMLRGIWIGFISNLKARFTTSPFSSQIYILRK